MNLPISIEEKNMTFFNSALEPYTNATDIGLPLYIFPKGLGYVHLGKDDRAFYLSMWHELHCLRIIQKLLENPDDRSFGGEGHLQHCLNYLRQYLLCNADDTLEPGDYHSGPAFFERKCRDWKAVHDFSDRNSGDFDISLG